MKQTHLIARELIRFLPRASENAMPFSSVLHHLEIGIHEFKKADVRSMLDRFSRHESSDLMKCCASKGFFVDLKGRNDGYDGNPIIPRPRNLKREPEQLSDLPERSQNIISLYNSGKSLQEIGDEFGLTRERVRQILLPARRLNLIKNPKRNRRSKLSHDAGKKIARAHREKYKVSVNFDRNRKIEILASKGFSYGEIANRVKVSRSCVCAVMYRAKRRSLAVEEVLR